MQSQSDWKQTLAVWGQATRNASEAISYVQTTEGALNETSNILIRLRELSIQAASDSTDDSGRALLDLEREQLVNEVDRIANSADFNGVKVINGEGSSEFTFQVGANGGEENRILYDASVTDATTSSLGVSGLDISYRDNAEEGILDLDVALDKISGFRANLGAVQSRLRSTINNLQIQKLNGDEARSVIQDADIAEETSKLARSNVIKQAGISSLVNANNIPNAALRLIG